MRRSSEEVALLRGVTEDHVQRACVVLLETLERVVPGFWWTAVNPAPTRISKRAAGRAKWLGLRPGAPDIILVWRGRFHGIEVKRPVRSFISAEQKATHQEIILAGGVVTVVRSVDELADFLATIGINAKEAA